MAVTVAQFLQALESSGLIHPDELATLSERFSASERESDAQPLAKSLVREKKLTPLQAGYLYHGKGEALTLGNYLLLEKLGSGGMGVVFKARHRRLGRVVAVKVLAAEVTKDPLAVKRFEREVRAAGQLLHPNIVTAYDADEAQGHFFLVMEFVDGQDLASVVRENGPLTVEQAVDYILQAAKGLEYAHHMGVIHRDIKPGNLLLARDGTIKILDMGLARLDESAVTRTAPDELTRSGQVMGTVDYMAPEQGEDTRQADQRSDIYSLGCTLFRLLTGEPPYLADSLVRRFLAHREAPIPSLRARRPETPQRLDDICRKMLAKRPEDRYQNMAELIEALEQVARECDAPAPPALPEMSTEQEMAEFFRGRVSETAVARQTTPTATEATPRMEMDDTLRAASFAARVNARTSRLRRGLMIGGCAAAITLAMAIAGWFFLGENAPNQQDGLNSPPKRTPDQKPIGIAPSGQPLRVLFVLPQNSFWEADYLPIREQLERSGNGIRVDVACATADEATGNNRMRVNPDLTLANANVADYAAVVFGGKLGVNEFIGNPEHAATAKAFIESMLRSGKIVASICRGNLVPLHAGALENRAAARSRYIYHVDIPSNATVEWRNREYVEHAAESGIILTGREPNDAAPFGRRLLELLQERRR
jgi:serine/threonine protein kinase/putative intracellular protease/amidase